MQRMSKQKGKKLKSKFRSALMNEFNKKVSKKKPSTYRGARKIQTVAEIQEESENERQKYFTRERQEKVPKGINQDVVN
jgi:5S rRNA maturation endonuclease (ribonuclease M5)